MAKAKKKTTKSTKKLVSEKRAKEIEGTFQTLGLITHQPYQDATNFGNQFQRVSLYDSETYYYSTSDSSNG